MVLKRLKVFIESKGLSVSAFEKSIGMSNASFGKSLKNNGAIGSDKLEKILKEYPEINPEWLLTGQGDMIKNKLEIQSHEVSMLYNMYNEEKSKVESQAEQIGALKQTIRQLEDKIEGLQSSDAESDSDNEDAPAANIADVG